MRVGVPREITIGEDRVGLLPFGVETLHQKEHSVLVETQAGAKAGFSDADYRKAGATVVSSSEEVWARAEMVVKLHEPTEPEWLHLRPGQIVLAFFYFGGPESLPLLRACLESGAVCIAQDAEALETDPLRFVLAIASNGWKAALQNDDALRRSLCIADRKVAFAPLAQRFGLPFHAPETLLG